MNFSILRIHIAVMALLLGLCTANAEDRHGTPATLQSEPDRKLAPGFALKDGSGTMVNLKDYAGKVVLLDFWATWCHGCKEEIPWFSNFEKKYGGLGVAVVGVSMDEGGWKIVNPFLSNIKVRYPILLGDKPTWERYGLNSLPDTFLIDREGRVAAVYTKGLVNRRNIEANIRNLLSKRAQADILASDYDRIRLKKP